MHDAYEAMMAEAEGGRTNSNTFWNAAEVIFGKDTLEELEYNTDRVIELAEQQRSAWEWGGDDASDAASGMLQYIYNLQQAGKVSKDLIDIQKQSDGSFTIDFDADRLPELADQLNWTEGALDSFIQAWGILGPIDMTGIDDIIEKLTKLDLIVTDDSGKSYVAIDKVREALENAYDDETAFRMSKLIEDSEKFTTISLGDDSATFLEKLSGFGAASAEVDGATKIWSVDVDEMRQYLMALGYSADEVTEKLQVLYDEQANLKLKSGGEEVTIDDATGKLVRKRRNDYQELVAELQNLEAEKKRLLADNDDVTEVSAKISDVKDQLLEVDDAVKNSYYIDSSLVDKGIGSVVEYVKNYKDALDEANFIEEQIKNAKAAGLDTSQLEEDLYNAKQKVNDLWSLIDQDKEMKVLVRAETQGELANNLLGDGADAYVQEVINAQIKEQTFKAAKARLGKNGYTEAEIEKVKKGVEEVGTAADNVAKKNIGDLGAGAAAKAFDKVNDNIKTINRAKLTDKKATYTITTEYKTDGKSVTANTTTTGNKYTTQDIISAGAQRRQTNASAYGTDGAKAGVSLVGELGRELVVSDGRFYTVGDNGAELVTLKKGDIVFNHLDTEKIFAGRTGARGTALAEGNAYANHTAISMNRRAHAAVTPTQKKNTSAEEEKAEAAKKAEEEAKEAAEKAAEEQKKAAEEAAEAQKKAAEDAQKAWEDRLKNIKDTADKYLDYMQHRIFIMEQPEYHLKSLDSIIAHYEKMQDYVHSVAQKYRSLGLKEDDQYIIEASEKWYEYRDNIVKSIKEAYDGYLDWYKNANSLHENVIQDSAMKGAQAKSLSEMGTMIANYKEMQRLVHEEADRYRRMGFGEYSEEISELTSLWWEYKEDVANTIKDTYDAIVATYDNSIEKLQRRMTESMSDGQVKDAIKAKDEIVENYRKMQELIHQEANRYRALGYSETSDEISDLSDLWWEYEDNVKEVLNDLVDSIIDSANDSLDSIQNVFDTLQKAANEYKENGGFISVDTFQEIANLGPEYLRYLEDENGLLVINRENIQKVIAARTNQLAVDSALAYVEKIRAAQESGSRAELERLLYATDAATEGTWGLVYANLALADLSDKQYEAARHNIDALYSLSKNA